MNSMSPVLRRRRIEDDDLDDVAALLASGFPERPLAWWRRGLARMREREVPDGCARFGTMLESGGRPVGALLMIHAEIHEAGRSFVRCNLSSWYTEPAFAAQAPLLLGAALRDRSVTFINISPASHTQPIIAAQGFRPFAEGSLVTVPAVARRHGRARVRVLTAADAASFPEAALLAEHLGVGCLCLAVEAGGEVHPFVFSRVRALRRVVPASQLLYCRDLADYVRFAGAISGALLRRGVPLVLVDGPTRLPGMPTRVINAKQKKYVVGPNPPRVGDLAYTELAVFG